MAQMREAVGFVAFLIGAAALTAVSHHPTHGRHTERERDAVVAVAGQFTHQQIADALAQTKLGKGQALHEIEQSFPLPVRTVREDGAGIVFTLRGHGTTCVDFTSRSDGSTVAARHC
ncbi:MAG: hypothetical protein LC792_18730 [Actinobacteria bacterium]|nr:hypothetical protein [Actinomycetota bacterium]